MAFLMFGSVCLMMQKLFLGITGILLFGILFYFNFSLYIGAPVRKWLKRDIDYDALEKSYVNADSLFIKRMDSRLERRIYMHIQKRRCML